MKPGIKSKLGLWFVLGVLSLTAAADASSTAQKSALTRTILVAGDSLSAGYGIDASSGWVARLGNRVARRSPVWQMVNASVSGDTTDDGLLRLPGALARHRPALVLLELGANDGLRGQPPARIQANLEQLLDMIAAAGSQAVVIGIRLPPNYGPRYLDAFEAIYNDIATARDLPLVPFLLEGVAGNTALMQPDGLHPTAEAQPAIEATVWSVLAPEIDAAEARLP